MSPASDDFKRAFQSWKQRVLLALLGVPELVDAAMILEYGEIQLIVDNGKIKFVNMVPKVKNETRT